MKKLSTRILLTVLFCVMVLFQGETVQAQTNSQIDDPEYWKAQGYVSDEFYDDAESTEYMIRPYAFRGDYTQRLGVDVSKYQGTIDWAKAKAQGVEFAIIRVGYRGSGSGSLNEDPNYIRNIEGALAQGIPVGVYIFSQAITEAEAIEEANYVISRIYRYNITLPIVIDFEYASGSSGNSGRLYEANLSKAQATAICKAFCRTVQNAGYTGMVYANKSMLTSGLNAAEIAEDYRIWLAHYTSSTNYAGIYDFWQYTSTGNGAAYGMGSQYVDLNYWYDDGRIYGQDYSSVFDATYYADKNSDLKATFGYNSAALLTHFVNYGMAEGRQGGAGFNVQSYKNAYKDLRDGLGDDLKGYYTHYINYGKSEGRVGIGYESTIVGATTIYNGVDYSSVYDASYYVNKYPDLLSAFGYNDEKILAHFVNSGMKEGRQACEDFNVQSYKNAYKDLRDAFGNDLKNYYLHYMKQGGNEGRVGTGYETSVIGAITIYKGVDYSSVYDINYYLKNNPDLLRVYGYDEEKVLEHFVNSGMQEGRQASQQFNVHTYKDRYSDLRNAYGNNLRSYYMHYMNYGKNEGRRAF